ncbi:MAG: alanine racemase [Alphaproteobacteria bacterium]|nr:alanine racemase [Alphaproteobacteria bacterium]
MQPALAIPENSLPSYVTGVLEIDTRAIAQNYKTLQAFLTPSICAAVLKADAYGFGAKEIASLLWQEDCKHFFVAHLEEGLSLRKQLKDPTIYVFSGLLPGTSDIFVEHKLIPVLNDFWMVNEWAKEAKKVNKALPCALHFDTGMHRNGFDQQHLAQLFDEIDLLNLLEVKLILSHLVSSHDTQDPLNIKQNDLFNSIRKRFPKAKASLADTGGIYLGKSYHYDLARPGKGLFGLFPSPKGTTPLQQCTKVRGRIIQVRSAHKGESVGYGATYVLSRESKLATLGIGFADGYDRRFSNNAHVEIQGFKAPIVGRISMDYTVIDVTDIPEILCYTGGWAELVNKTLTLDSIAHNIGTISRELSTGFGKRLYRVYL